MNILIVYRQTEPISFNAAMFGTACETHTAIASP